MKTRDRILTVLFIIVWGANFTVTKVGIGNMPPMLMASLRFLMVAIPAVFFVRPPRMPWYLFAGYGLTIGVGQFTCLYYAIYIGMPAGLTSVILQASSFITILLAALVFHERLKAHQIAGLAVAVAGLTLIGLASGAAGSTYIPPLAIVLSLMAAFFWSVSTIIIKKASLVSQAANTPLNMFSVVAWTAIIPPIPMLLLAFTMDPPAAIWEACKSLSPTAILAVLFLSWCSTLFGAGTWNYLLSKYETGRVAPLSLLVPIVGLLVAGIVLNERLSALQWAGSAVTIAGLVVFNLGLRPLHSLIARRNRFL